MFRIFRFVIRCRCRLVLTVVIVVVILVFLVDWNGRLGFVLFVLALFVVLRRFRNSVIDDWWWLGLFGFTVCLF